LVNHLRLSREIWVEKKITTCPISWFFGLSKKKLEVAGFHTFSGKLTTVKYHRISVTNGQK